jgi:UDP-N-acetylglucosamine:LPS N-acetylglucosamine transferase
LEQNTATAETAFASLQDLVENEQTRAGIRTALVRWHAPRAAEEIADHILQVITQRAGHRRTETPQVACGCCKAGA